ncbi:hypothetical protein [Thalassospira povalilytica]|uniref:hypothetical protein n=1 Tax=Thalassospira povalilytica TaxID=732237 RepID=UPI0014781529|nr:hypothetical protein [Thalassospira povalilytica]
MIDGGRLDTGQTRSTRSARTKPEKLVKTNPGAEKSRLMIVMAAGNCHWSDRQMVRGGGSSAFVSGIKTKKHQRMNRGAFLNVIPIGREWRE